MADNIKSSNMGEQDRIKEGNRIIAEFDGYKYDPDASINGIKGVLLHEAKSNLLLEHWHKGQSAWSAGYHTNWSSLMPIVEKICRLKVGDGIEYVDYSFPRTFGMINEDTSKLMVRLNGHACFEADTLIEATYLAVVDFIKFYNQNSNR